MQVFRNINEVVRDENTALTVGTFDGVHLAHRHIINKVLELAKKNNSRSFIVTFEPHPQEVLKTKTPDIKMLCSIDEKLKMFESLGVGNVLVIEFTEDFSKTQARVFYEKLVCGKIGISDLVVGYDHLFGRNREGDFEMLKSLGKEFNFEVHQVAEVDIESMPVSSTRIRRAMAEGKIEEANALLGYEYGFDGIVIEGDKVGRTIGFPTVNFKPVKENKVMPNDGIYCVKVKYNNEGFFGMMYVGYRPTLSDGKVRALEVNIFDFEKTVYGEKLRINFLTKLRNDKKFDSTEALIAQIKKDKEDSLKFINIKIKT
jgi:riboflavin kinase/FMN adenylyltransferase